MREKLRKLIEENHLTINQLSYEAKVTNQSLYRFLKEPDADLSIKNAVKIADYFGVSMDWLLGRKV